MAASAGTSASVLIPAAGLRWGTDGPLLDLPAADEVLLIGTGTSGDACRMAALCAAGSGKPVTVHSGSGLPSWAPSRRPLVVVVSFTGDDEEAVTALSAATAAGLPAVAVASGGAVASLAGTSSLELVRLPGEVAPQWSIGHLTAAVLRVLDGAGVTDGSEAQLGAAADSFEEMLGSGAGAGYLLGVDLAAALNGKISVIHGGPGVAAVAAQRWTTQLDEIAGLRAFASDVPHLDHDALAGWESDPRTAMREVGVVVVRDRAGDRSADRHAPIAEELVVGRVTIAGEVISIGESVLARLFSLVAVGGVVAAALRDR